VLPVMPPVNDLYRVIRSSVIYNRCFKFSDVANANDVEVQSRVARLYGSVVSILVPSVVLLQ